MPNEGGCGAGAAGADLQAELAHIAAIVQGSPAWSAARSDVGSVPGGGENTAADTVHLLDPPSHFARCCSRTGEDVPAIDNCCASLPVAGGIHLFPANHNSNSAVADYALPPAAAGPPRSGPFAALQTRSGSIAFGPSPARLSTRVLQ